MDTFPFVLALDLGRTLSEVEALPNTEYLAWQAYYAYRRTMADFENDRRP